MGGYGSGRWGGYGKKSTVEECRVLDIATFRQRGFLRAGYTGNCRWSDWQGNEVASIGYAATGNAIRLYYTIHWRDREPEQIDYPVPVVWVPCNFGGQRPLFVCPGTRCGGQRAAKLYLPPGGRYFLCRHCHDLSYRSRQEYNKREALWHRDPEAYLAMLREKLRRLGHGKPQKPPPKAPRSPRTRRKPQGRG